MTEFNIMGAPIIDRPVTLVWAEEHLFADHWFQSAIYFSSPQSKCGERLFGDPIELGRRCGAEGVIRYVLRGEDD